MRALMRLLSTRAGLDDPHPIYAALREAAPMHELPHFGPGLTRYADVRAVLFDRDLRVSSQAAKPGSARADIAAKLPPDLQALPPPLFLQDDPAHKRLRRLIASAFSQRAVDALAGRMEAIAHMLLDALEDREAFDAIEHFAVPFPALIIAHILGVRAGRLGQFRIWSEAVIAELHPLASPVEREGAISAHRALAHFFRGELAERRHSPCEDLISELARAEGRSELSEEEAVSLCVNLLVAGHFTTTDLIGSLIYLLLKHPEQRRLLARQPALWPQAVDEALRIEPPTPLLARVFPKAAQLCGRAFEQGDNLNLFVAAANRDPRVFPDPDCFDVTRNDIDHVSFGGGAHYCLGAPLARAEAEIAVRVFFERLPRLSLIERGLAWRRSPNFRGLSRLELKQGPPERVEWPDGATPDQTNQWRSMPCLLE